MTLWNTKLYHHSYSKLCSYVFRTILLEIQTQAFGHLKNVLSFLVFFRFPLLPFPFHIYHSELSPTIKLYYAVDLRDSIRESAF